MPSRQDAKIWSGKFWASPKAAKWEERHISDTGGGEFIDQSIVIAMHQVVVVLHTDDLAKTAGFAHLRRCHVAEADVPD
jgi:hypothetical protein